MNKISNGLRFCQRQVILDISPGVVSKGRAPRVVENVSRAEDVHGLAIQLHSISEIGKVTHKHAG